MEKVLFADRLKEALKIKKISAAELSRKSGVPESVISHYKQNKYVPKDDRLELLAKILGVSPVWLDGYDAPMQPNSNEQKDEIADDTQTADRIRELREANNLSIEDASEQLEISQSTLLRWENGDGVEKITTTVIKNMIRVYKTNWLYLLGESSDPSYNIERLVKKVDSIDADTFYVAAIVKTITPGPMGFIFDDILGYQSIEDDQRTEYFYFKSKGNSMAPAINDSDISLIHRQDDVESGDLAVVVINDNDAAIRRIIKKDDSVSIFANDIVACDPIVINPNSPDTMKIVGRVISTSTTRVW